MIIDFNISDLIKQPKPCITSKTKNPHFNEKKVEGQFLFNAMFFELGYDGLMFVDPMFFFHPRGGVT